MKKIMIFLLAGCFHQGFAQQLAGSRETADSLAVIGELVSAHRYMAALEGLEGISRDTNSVELLNIKGYCYSRLGMFPKAVAAYERALEADSANRTTLSRLADLYKGRKAFLKAHQLYSRLSKMDSLNSYFYKQNARCLYKAGMVPFSIASYEQANRLNPHDEEVVLALAGIYFELDDLIRCDSLIARALAAGISGPGILSLKARSKYHQKEYDSALVALEAVFSLGDTSLTNMRLAGNALYALDNYSESISWFEMIPPELREKDEYIQYMMGVSYRHLRRPGKSVAHLKKAIALGISDNISIYYRQLGLSHEANGDAGEAIAAFKTAGNYKKEGILYYQIARIHDYYRHDPEAALEYYKRYLASGDSSVQKAWKFSRERVMQLE